MSKEKDKGEDETLKTTLQHAHKLTNIIPYLISCTKLLQIN